MDNLIRLFIYIPNKLIYKLLYYYKEKIIIVNFILERNFIILYNN